MKPLTMKMINAYMSKGICRYLGVIQKRLRSPEPVLMFGANAALRCSFLAVLKTALYWVKLNADRGLWATFTLGKSGIVTSHFFDVLI